MMKKFFMAGLVTLGLLASCSTDDDATTGGGSTGNAYLQVQLEVDNGMGTRAENVPEKNATDAEVAVKNLTVALVDPTSNIIRQVYTFQASDLKTGTEKTKAATKPFLVSQGTYDVYVFANSTNYSGIAVNANVKTAILSVNSYTGTNCPMASTDNGFLMSNAYYVTKSTVIKPSQGTDKATDTEVDYAGSEMSTGGQTNINVVKDVEIERAVAKVEAKQETSITNIYKEGSDTEILGTCTIAGVDLINLNSKTYAVKNKLGASGISAPMAYDDLYYVQDPNYASADQNTSEFYNTTSSTFTELTTTNNTATFYCLENTMEAAAQLNGYTTGLLYKVKVVLDNDNYSTLLSSGGDDPYSQKFALVVQAHSDLANVFTTASTDGSFYEYGGFYFKNGDAAKMYKVIGNNLSATDATTIYTAYGTGYDETADTDIHKYTEGYAYYPAWIRHNTTDAGYLAQGKYGVVRNHWYEVVVTKISGLGYYKPTYEGEEDPDDEAEAKLQVAVKIKAWRHIQQSVEL